MTTIADLRTQRSDEEVIARAPVTVDLGGKAYEIRPLPIGKAGMWRKKALALVDEITTDVGAILPSGFKIENILSMEMNPEGIPRLLQSILFVIPDKLYDLFFSYAEQLPREEIEAVATDEEMLPALMEVARIAFPFVKGWQSAIPMMQKIGETSPEQSES